LFLGERSSRAATTAINLRLRVVSMDDVTMLGRSFGRFKAASFATSEQSQIKA
jgi:hypothetical protein